MSKLDMRKYSKKIELRPVKDIWTDKLTIEILGEKVRFHAAIDGSGNLFEINKDFLIEEMMGK